MVNPKQKTDKARESARPDKARPRPDESEVDPELDAQLDEELDETFPASDPPSVTRDARSGFRTAPPPF